MAKEISRKTADMLINCKVNDFEFVDSNTDHLCARHVVCIDKLNGKDVNIVVAVDQMHRDEYECTFIQYIDRDSAMCLAMTDGGVFWKIFEDGKEWLVFGQRITNDNYLIDHYKDDFIFERFLVKEEA